MTPGASGGPPGMPGEVGEGFRERFERGLGFPLDGFQRRSMDAIDRGESVLVSAPTGSGKTLIADYAAARALERGGQGLLHHADQGPVQPEVRRAVRCATARTGWGC